MLRYIIYGYNLYDGDQLIAMVKTENEIQAAIDTSTEKLLWDNYYAEIWNVEECIVVGFLRNLKPSK